MQVKREVFFLISEVRSTALRVNRSSGWGLPPLAAGAHPERRLSFLNLPRRTLFSSGNRSAGWGLPPRRAVHPKSSRPNFRNEKKNFAFYLHVNLESKGLHVSALRREQADTQVRPYTNHINTKSSAIRRCNTSICMNSWSCVRCIKARRVADLRDLGLEVRL